jgi:hypothetical protein
MEAMTIPVWVLLGFAVWTIAVLMAGIGIRRWSLILMGRAQLTDFPSDQPHGSTAYRRAVRAHANCVENLPVFGAIVFALSASQTASATIDMLAIVFLIARICQSLVHMTFAETNATVLIRFSFFAAQLAIMLTFAVMVANHVI